MGLRVFVLSGWALTQVQLLVFQGSIVIFIMEKSQANTRAF